MKSEIYTEALEKLKSYCAYQERCEFEVIKKLESLGINEAGILTLISKLKQQNYLDNGRYAEAFTSGKHKIKGWGKVKIRVALKAKRLPEELITKALEQLDQEVYSARLNEVAQKKWRLLGDKKDQNTRQKLFRFLYGKGYESELVNRIISELWGRSF